MARKALLLGIIDYESDVLNSLENVPQKDVEILTEALKIAGYQDELINQAVKPHGKKGIINKVRGFLDSAGKKDDLIIYFSGHGSEGNGRRYLIPYDCDPTYDPSYDDLVSDDDLFAYARSSKAKSVVFFIDACREGVQLSFAQSGTKTIPQREINNSSQERNPSIAFIYSCGQKEPAHWGVIYSKDPCSYFAYALSETLRSSEIDPPAILQDVISHSQALLDEHATAENQQITASDLKLTGAAGEPLQLLIRDNARVAFDNKIKESSWCQQLKKLKLWQSTFTDEPASALVKQMLSVVYEAELIVAEANKITEQRWRPQNAPFHMLQRIDLLLNVLQPSSQLPSQLKSSSQLKPEEVILLLCTPFIYESILASLEIQFNQLITSPETMDTASSSLAIQSWYVYKNEEGSWGRHADLLNKKKQTHDANDVLWCQFFQFAHQSGELWSYQAKEGKGNKALGWVNAELSKILKLATFDDVHKDKKVEKIFGSNLLPELARQMFTSTAEVDRYVTKEEDTEIFTALDHGEGEHRWQCDPLNVLPLIAMTARMAMDPRRLHDAAAEHIGLDENFNLDIIQHLVDSQQASWHEVLGNKKNINGFSLKLECPHQALDFALLKLVDELNQLCPLLHKIRGDEPWPVICFDHDKLTPTVNEGIKKYVRPHVRFGLDERKSMQLLMGEKLYGDPQLALRELYQNALDACRYRQARENYLFKIGELDSSTYSRFEGKIQFKSGREEDTGRPYIECTDNGIGMAEKHLSRLFANGGSRFAESHEFQVERAQWAMQDIPFYPNSRFGVGVLSYFMLADQIEVETSRLDKSGKRRESLLAVTIQGSNSIFRIQKKENSGELQLGSKIRLYLRDANHNPDNALASIKTWLALSEFNTHLIDSQDQLNILEAGQYYPIEGSAIKTIPIDSANRQNGQTRLFWAINLGDIHKGYSSILVDGIRLHSSELNSSDLIRSEVGNSFGVIINFTDELSINLSVDRKNILDINNTNSIIHQLLVADQCKALLTKNHPCTLTELSQLTRMQPQIMSSLDFKLRANEVELSCKLRNGVPINLAGKGISPLYLFIDSDGRINTRLSQGNLNDTSAKLELCLRRALTNYERLGGSLSPNLLLLARFDQTQLDFYSDCNLDTWVLMNNDRGKSLTRVISLSKHCNTTLTDTVTALEQANRLTEFGVAHLLYQALLDARFTEQHLALWMQIEQFTRYNQELNFWQLARIQHETKQPFQELLELTALFAELDLVSFNTTQLEKVKSCVPDDKSLQLYLTINSDRAFFDEYDNTLPGLLSQFQDVEKLKAFQSELSMLSKAGLISCSEQVVNAIIDGCFDQQLVSLLSNNYPDHWREFDPTFTFKHIYKATVEWGCSLRQVADKMQFLIGLGLTDFTQGQLDAINDDRLQPRHLKALCDGRFEIKQLIINLGSYQEDIEQVITLYQPIANLKLTRLTMYQIECLKAASKEQLNQLAYLLQAKWKKGLTFDLSELIKASIETKQSLAEMRPILDFMANLELLDLDHEKRARLTKINEPLTLRHHELYSIRRRRETCDEINLSKILAKAAEWKEPISYVIQLAQPFFDCPQKFITLVNTFEQLTTSDQQALFKTIIEGTKRINVLEFAQELITPDMNWQALLAGLEALAMCDLDVTEVTEFVFFFQKKVEQEEFEFS